MTFSFLHLTEQQRVFLLGFAAGLDVEAALAIIPSPRTGEMGMGTSTYYQWLEKPVFKEAMDNIRNDPDWANDYIASPWALANDNLMLIQRMLGHKVVKDRPWAGLSAKQRELLLTERGKLSSDAQTQDRFLSFFEKLDRVAERRQKALAEAQPRITLLPNPD
jgi:hypothetical protein